MTPDLCNLTREGFKFKKSSPKAASLDILLMHIYKSIAAKTCVAVLAVGGAILVVMDLTPLL